jgi:hypothetical protein
MSSTPVLLCISHSPAQADEDTFGAVNGRNRVEYMGLTMTAHEEWDLHDTKTL